MGGIFGFGDKTQTTSNVQIGASEEATQATGGSLASREGDVSSATGSNVAQGGSSVIGSGSIGAQGGGVAVGGGSILNAGGVSGTTNTGTITINGAAGAEALAKSFSDTIKQINDTASADKLAAQQVLSDALGKVTELSESKQTEGVSSLGRLVLWGMGILLAGVLIWKWNK